MIRSRIVMPAGVSRYELGDVGETFSRAMLQASGRRLAHAALRTLSARADQSYAFLPEGVDQSKIAALESGGLTSRFGIDPENAAVLSICATLEIDQFLKDNPENACIFDNSLLRTSDANLRRFHPDDEFVDFDGDACRLALSHSTREHVTNVFDLSNSWLRICYFVENGARFLSSPIYNIVLCKNPEDMSKSVVGVCLSAYDGESNAITWWPSRCS